MAKKVDLKAKAKRQKILAGVLGLVLLAVLGFEGPKTLKQLTGPKVDPGKHQDPEQFRDDVRRALGARFAQFVGAGAVDGDPTGGFRYKVAVQGRQTPQVLEVVQRRIQPPVITWMAATQLR